ncbi:putative receptor-like protein kinase At3g47110 [Tripterygium wilfordii]|uniref:putative receptor-like protein kinase At3g47110 n=1 Tax=Tripterygium wilfordii TaxID=458696 RepID=UPI0018F860F1|nr:putative receptor-like protein kinase At3g47110 [Tripterygium wilfordii]
MKFQKFQLCISPFTDLQVLILFLTTNIQCWQPVSMVDALGNETDRVSLLKFKESIADDPYESLNSWNDSVPFCNWYGTTCSPKHQRVTSLDLEGLALRGTMSSYIGNLSFLRILNLQNNNFYGDIPQEVGFLFRLQQLNLTNNTFGGEILASLSNCFGLRIIDLGWNGLIGRIPADLGSLTGLMAIRLSRNSLTGGLPSSFDNLSALISFSVQLIILKEQFQMILVDGRA